MLAELRRREIRTFIASAIFRRNSIFFKPYGWWWRDALHSFESIFVQDENSKTLLAELGVENVVVAGDTRFDRVLTIAEKSEKVEIVEQFKGDKRLFVAGSTWGPEENILLPLINDNPDIKFVISPHEMDESRIERILHETKGGAVRYTQLPSDFADKQVLILDTLGLLSRVYSSAEWAYIGGGFGAGIHNVLEAAVYGVPVFFGPNNRKFQEVQQLKACGGGVEILATYEFVEKMETFVSDDSLLKRAGKAAGDLVAENAGATSRIFAHLGL
jgi:3-deoxy-D-manno-octulosonic-acid transferase